MAQKDGERPILRFSAMISHIKVARCATAELEQNPFIRFSVMKGLTIMLSRIRLLILEKLLGKMYSGQRDNIFYLLKRHWKRNPGFGMWNLLSS